MVFDPERHEISPETGFAVDKVTGHPVGLVGAPAGRVGPGSEWPKWVAVHESHVVRKQFEGAPEHVSVAGFEEWHVNRADGSVTVLVADEAAAQRAASEKGTPEPIKESETDAEARVAAERYAAAKNEAIRAAQDKRDTDLRIAAAHDTDQRVADEEREHEAGVKAAADRVEAAKTEDDRAIEAKKRADAEFVEWEKTRGTRPGAAASVTEAPSVSTFNPASYDPTHDVITASDADRHDVPDYEPRPAPVYTPPPAS